MGKSVKPGHPCPKSGQYQVVGPKGGRQPNEVTGVFGKTMPPTPKAGQHFELVDPTKHKG